MKLDVIITATNKPSLKKVLQHFSIYKNRIHKIIIVDFDKHNPSISESFLSGFRKEFFNINYIFVNQKAHFNKSLAINVGVSFSCSNMVLICDADVKLNADYLDAVQKYSDLALDGYVITPECVIESENGKIRNAPGICALSKANFHKVNGYSSIYQGWGFEDMDFLNRLMLLGLELKKSGSGIHLSHDDAERTRNYSASSVIEMRERNLKTYELNKANAVLLGTLDIDINNIIYDEV